MDKEHRAAPARILIVDDHPIVRHGLSALLAKEKEFAVCGEAGTIREAEEAIANLHPDVLIIDITLKDENGLHLIPLARKKRADIKCLVLSMHDEQDFAERALRAGARGYVMKENADEVLVDALRTILRGEFFVSTETAARMLHGFLEEPGETAPATHGVEALTERELEVFECIGQGLSTRKIADKLGLSDRTVEVHRAHIKKKMQCEDTAQLFREAVRWAEGKKNL